MVKDAKAKFSSADPASAAWRRAQMIENNAIEGLYRDPQLAKMVASLQAEGLTAEEQIARLLLAQTRADAAE